MEAHRWIQGKEAEELHLWIQEKLEEVVHHLKEVAMAEATDNRNRFVRTIIYSMEVPSDGDQTQENVATNTSQLLVKDCKEAAITRLYATFATKK